MSRRRPIAVKSRAAIPPDETADCVVMTPRRLADELERISLLISRAQLKMRRLCPYVDSLSFYNVANSLAVQVAELGRLSGDVLVGKVPIVAGRDEAAGRDRYPLLEATADAGGGLTVVAEASPPSEVPTVRGKRAATSGTKPGVETVAPVVEVPGPDPDPGPMPGAFVGPDGPVVLVGPVMPPPPPWADRQFWTVHQGKVEWGAVAAVDLSDAKRRAKDRWPGLDVETARFTLAVEDDTPAEWKAFPIDMLGMPKNDAATLDGIGIDDAGKLAEWVVVMESAGEFEAERLSGINRAYRLSVIAKAREALEAIRPADDPQPPPPKGRKAKARPNPLSQARIGTYAQEARWAAEKAAGRR